MWLPVVDDSTYSRTDAVEEPIVEAIVEVVPEAVLACANVAFVWIRERPTEPLPDNLVVALRSDATAADRLAAMIRDDHGVVLEIYIENVASALTDEWLQQEWGLCPGSLRLTLTEKLEITFFGLLVHVAVRHALAEETKQLVRKIGRVVFRAAVRAALQKLKETYPDMKVDRVAPSIQNGPNAPQGPIEADEAARVDYDQLLRKLLGLEPTEDGAGDADSSPDGHAP